MRLLKLTILLCITISTQATSLVVRDYFDGRVWRLGPFHIVVDGKKISQIEGPLSQKKLDQLELKKKSKNFHFRPDLDIIPGLVDSHVHLSFLDPSLDSSHDQPIKNMFTQVDISMNLAHHRLDQAAQRGFLTIRDLGGNPLVIQSLKRRVQLSPHKYPNFYSINPAFASHKGQCPKFVNCMQRFKKLPLTPAKLRAGLAMADEFIHNKVFLDNDPFPGVLKKNHIIPLLIEAKKMKSSLAIHAVKQRDFSWLTPYLYPQVSIEHLNSIEVEKLNKVKEEFIKSRVRLVPSLYPRSYLDHLNLKNKLPNELAWERANQLKKLKTLKAFTSQLCFGSDFYFPTYSPLRDSFYYSIEIMRDLVEETFLKADQVLAMATSGCSPLFPGTSIGILKVGSNASFNLVGGDLKSDIKYLHDIRGVVHFGRILRLEAF